jgi:hypothetical protein
MANPLYIHSTKLLHVLPFLGGREVNGNEKKFGDVTNFVFINH